MVYTFDISNLDDLFFKTRSLKYLITTLDAKICNVCNSCNVSKRITVHCKLCTNPARTLYNVHCALYVKLHLLKFSLNSVLYILQDLLRICKQMGLRKYKSGQICVHRLKIARSVRKKYAKTRIGKFRYFSFTPQKCNIVHFSEEFGLFTVRLAQFTVYTVCMLSTGNSN